MGDFIKQSIVKMMSVVVLGMVSTGCTQLKLPFQKLIQSTSLNSVSTPAGDCVAIDHGGLSVTVKSGIVYTDSWSDTSSDSCPSGQSGALIHSWNFSQNMSCNVGKLTLSSVTQTQKSPDQNGCVVIATGNCNYSTHGGTNVGITNGGKYTDTWSTVVNGTCPPGDTGTISSTYAVSQIISCANTVTSPGTATQTLVSTNNQCIAPVKACSLTTHNGTAQTVQSGATYTDTWASDQPVACAAGQTGSIIHHWTNTQIYSCQNGTLASGNSTQTPAAADTNTCSTPVANCTLTTHGGATQNVLSGATYTDTWTSDQTVACAAGQTGSIIHHWTNTKSYTCQNGTLANGNSTQTPAAADTNTCSTPARNCTLTTHGGAIQNILSGASYTDTWPSDQNVACAAGQTGLITHHWTNAEIFTCQDGTLSNGPVSQAAAGADTNTCATAIVNCTTPVGTSGQVGLPGNPDGRFFCYNGAWYDCGWELNDPSWETKVVHGRQVGALYCDRNSNTWTGSLPSGPQTHGLGRVFNKNPIYAAETLNQAPQFYSNVSTAINFDSLLSVVDITGNVAGKLANGDIDVSSDGFDVLNGISGVNNEASTANARMDGFGNWLFSSVNDSTYSLGQLMAYYWVNFEKTTLAAKLQDAAGSGWKATGKDLPIYSHCYNSTIQTKMGLNAFFSGSNSSVSVNDVQTPTNFVCIGYHERLEGAFDASVYAHEMGHANIFFATNGQINQGTPFSTCTNANLANAGSRCCPTADGCGLAMNEGQADYHAFMTFGNTAVGEFFVQSIYGLAERNAELAPYMNALNLFAGNEPFPINFTSNSNIYSGTSCASNPSTCRYIMSAGPEVHEMGSAWNSALWTLRKAAGAQIADALFLKSIERLTGNDTFGTSLSVILGVDGELHGGANRTVIINSFAAHGITPK